MKKILLLLPAIYCCGTVIAQNAIVANAKMNIVYLGVANPMEAMAEKYACDQIVLATDNGKLEQQPGCRYVYYPENAGKATIRVMKGKMQVGEAIFRVKTPPPPIAAVAGKSNTGIRADVLKEQIGIMAVLNDFDYDIRYVITAFNMILVRKDGTAQTINTITGPYFNDAMKQLLQTAEPGDRLTFNNIVADAPWKQGIAVAPMGLTVE